MEVTIDQEDLNVKEDPGEKKQKDLNEKKQVNWIPSDVFLSIE